MALRDALMRSATISMHLLLRRGAADAVRGDHLYLPYFLMARDIAQTFSTLQ